MSTFYQLHQSFKGDLYWGLRTRVLTDVELSQVREFGYLLTVSFSISPSGGISGWSESYKKEEKIQEYNLALFHQAQLRILAEAKL